MILKTATGARRRPAEDRMVGTRADARHRSRARARSGPPRDIRTGSVVVNAAAFGQSARAPGTGGPTGPPRRVLRDDGTAPAAGNRARSRGERPGSRGRCGRDARSDGPQARRSPARRLPAARRTPGVPAETLPNCNVVGTETSRFRRSRVEILPAPRLQGPVRPGATPGLKALERAIGGAGSGDPASMEAFLRRCAVLGAPYRGKTEAGVLPVQSTAGGDAALWSRNSCPSPPPSVMPSVRWRPHCS